MMLVAFLKKHTTIKTKAILLVYIIIILYKFCYSLFQFSLVRFLKGGLGNATFLIGLMLALSNFIGIFFDIPLGIMQKYFRPRIFLLISVALLLISDLIFLFATLNIWLGFLAVFFYQMSIEVFFVTITTYILRLSSKEDYAQNLAQEDMADNIGDILGLGLGGVVFVIDHLLSAQHMFAASFLGVLILFVFIFIFEFVDRDHFSTLENYILNLKVPKQITTQASSLSDEIVQSSAPIPVSSLAQGKLTLEEIVQGFKNTFGNMIDIVMNKLHAPLLLWSMSVLAITYFWYVSINFFEPFFMKEIFQEGTGWIVDNIPKFIFESAMFITALVVPTFFFELPFGKLADQWGKEKMVILGTFFSGFSILILGIIQAPSLIFLLFLGINIGFVIIYPPIVGLIGEEYKKAVAQKRKDAGEEPVGESQQNQVEGESAGIISIVVNIGQMAAGLVGGLFLELFTFGTTYIFYGVFLILLGIGSILAFKYLFPQYNKEGQIAEPSHESSRSP